MQAKLQNRTISDNVIVAEFAVPTEFSFQPGEYVQIILPNATKHYYSVASSPNEKGIVRIATRPSQSEFKKLLSTMPLGTDVEIKGPWGDVLLPRDMSRPLVFIAGGIGITPFLSMARYAAEEHLSHKIKLLHFGDLDEFHHELEEFVGVNPNFEFQHIYSPISAESIKANLPDLDRIFYIAGPPGFVNVALGILGDLKIPPRQIISESYTGY